MKKITAIFATIMLICTFSITVNANGTYNQIVSEKSYSSIQLEDDVILEMALNNQLMTTIILRRV